MFAIFGQLCHLIPSFVVRWVGGWIECLENLSQEMKLIWWAVHSEHLFVWGKNKSELRRTTRRPMSIGGLLEATEKRNNEESRTKDFEEKRRKKGVKGSVPQQRK